MTSTAVPPASPRPDTRHHRPRAAGINVLSAIAIFAGLALVVSVGIRVWLRGVPARAQAWLACGLTLILGGALGNVIDRMRHGFVIDFVHAHWNDAWFPAFNVADAAITVGAACMIIDALLESRR